MGYSILFMSILRKNVDADWFLPLTAVEFEIMLSLARDERHGYAIMQEVEQRTEGAMILRPGTLYRAIGRLLENDLIQEAERTPGAAGEDPRRRSYRLTPLGTRVAVLEARRLSKQVRVARSRKLLRGEN
jgi:DNA-binding PadR family transcriptional regulator